MARLDKVASRYAKAIFDSEKSAGQSAIGELMAELARFSQLIEASKDLQYVLGTEIFSAENKRSIVEDLSTKLNLSTKAKQVLLVLLQMHRMGSLPAIMDRLNNLVLESLDIIPLHVETASSLSSEQKEKIEARFAKILGKKVQARYVSDPELIGGLKVTAEGRTFDGSLQGWLNAVGQHLTEATV